nr:hypothetical protein [Tanacetum cinerariifolium]
RTLEDRISGVVVTLFDITDRKQAEEIVRASEQRLQRMVNVPSVGVLTFDYTNRLLQANDAFLEMVGYTHQEFEARQFTWRDFTPPEHTEASQQVMAQLRQTVLPQRRLAALADAGGRRPRRWHHRQIRHRHERPQASRRGRGYRPGGHAAAARAARQASHRNQLETGTGRADSPGLRYNQHGPGLH